MRTARHRDHEEPARQGRRTGRAVVLGTTLVLAGTGVAAAYWTTHGQGTGTAATATPAPVTVTAGTPVSGLRPGASADLALVVANPNATDVTVPPLVLDTSQGDGGFAVDATHPACSPSSFALAPIAGGWTVPGRADSSSGTLAVTVEDAVTMSLDASDGCQGAVATVFVKAAR